MQVMFLRQHFLVRKLRKIYNKKALDILNENKDKLHELANFLYEKETITGEEFMQILES